MPLEPDGRIWPVRELLVAVTTGNPDEPIVQVNLSTEKYPLGIQYILGDDLDWDDEIPDGIALLTRDALQSLKDRKVLDFCSYEYALENEITVGELEQISAKAAQAFIDEVATLDVHGYVDVDPVVEIRSKVIMAAPATPKAAAVAGVDPAKTIDQCLEMIKKVSESGVPCHEEVAAALSGTIKDLQRRLPDNHPMADGFQRFVSIMVSGGDPGVVLESLKGMKLTDGRTLGQWIQLGSTIFMSVAAMKKLYDFVAANVDLHQLALAFQKSSNALKVAEAQEVVETAEATETVAISHS